MSLRRYTRSVDGTIPVRALLYEDEDLIASQEGIGIYDGTEKSAPHQSGTAHATTHRLFYIDAAQPVARSFELDLVHVARTEHYAGLFTSSPKITLHFHALPAPLSGGNDGAGSPADDLASRSWTCDVCAYRNPPGLSPAASRVCALCGVPRSSNPGVDIPRSAVPPTSALHLSTSLPASSMDLRAPTSAAPTRSPTPPASAGADGEIACSVCTFLNHPALAACEMCGTPLPRRPPQQQQVQARSAPASRPTTPSADDDGPDTRMIRLSFRRGGDKAFYAVLRRSLLGKGWEVKGVTKPTNTAGSSVTTQGHTATLSGINGILRTVETTAASSQNDMEDALKDLEALMVKWRDMVKLAQDLNERLTAVSTTAPATLAAPAASTEGASTGPALTTQAVEPEEATFIRSSLAQLGAQMPNAPVTLDMIRDERRWVDELARELAGVLQGTGGGKGEGIMRQRGVVGLDEVWGGWNRARGVALIPPSTFLTVLPHLPSHTSPPIQMRTLAGSGLSVLHTPPFTRAAFAARLVGLLALVGPKTVVEIAQEEAIPIGLAQEMVVEVEDEGEICRDEGGAGISAAGLSQNGEVRWWVNIFRGYVWDGQTD